MKIGLIQLDTIWHDKQANYAKAEGLIQKAAKLNCDIAVLPEMFNTGFSMELSEIGEGLYGPTSEFLKAAASRYNMGIIAGYPVLEVNGKGRNAAVAVNERGDVVATYLKIHSFSYADEHLYYLSGKTPIVFNIRGAKASVFICYDLRFPEIFRRVAKSVDCIFVIANWPETRMDHWNVLLKARAIENQCFVVGVNRTGTDENGLSYTGNSHVFSPSGVDLLTSSQTDELVIADIDLSEVAKMRSEFPFLSDMRDINEI